MEHMLSSANRKLFALRRLNKFGVQDQELVIIYRVFVPCVRIYSPSLAQFIDNWSN